MDHPHAPTKLFREEGKTGAIECPACGAPITLRSFGAIEQVACSYCGTVCKPEDDGSLDILRRAERRRQQSMLPLHVRGQIDGITWEVIGITWRQIEAYGVTYPWQEFLLFNPYEGYRWLIYSMSDGVWGFGGALPGAVEQVAGAHPGVEYRGEHYKHFTGGEAQTTYVEGEFPWQVLVGDVAQTNDYVRPPKAISIEVQHTEHGADINFTQTRPIEAAEVWSAFSLPDPPPTTYGIHPAAVNPHTTKFYWATAAVLVIVWVAAIISYFGARERETLLRTNLSPNGVVFTEELEIGTPGQDTTLEFKLEAGGMANSWAYAEILLVDIDNEEAIALGVEVDAWHGVTDGESWSEGTNPRRVVAGAVPGGKYLLQVTPQVDTGGQRASSLVLTVTRDVPLLRYMFLPLIVIIAFPAFNSFRRAAFETKRWASSDYSD
jgi:hypothetical protein